jgi:signal transduction histidine kinase
VAHVHVDDVGGGFEVVIPDGREYLLPGEDLPAVAHIVLQQGVCPAGEGQEAVSVTYRIRKESGDYTWFETLTEPILDESGEVVRLQTASRDVSERKRAEEALVEAARARAEFLAEVSHELRTPLTVIRGNAEVGLELDRNCEHDEVLREIVRESSTMSRMVEDLLFLARSESATPPFRMETVEAQVLLAGLERRAGALAADHDATLDTTLLATGLVRVDPVRVEQAVLALVDNAVKYGPRDSM